MNALALPGFWNRRDELCAAATLDNPLCRLTLVIKLPVPRRVLVGGVKNRLFEESIVHVTISPAGHRLKREKRFIHTIVAEKKHQSLKLAMP